MYISVGFLDLGLYTHIHTYEVCTYERAIEILN